MIMIFFVNSCHVLPSCPAIGSLLGGYMFERFAYGPTFLLSSAMCLAVGVSTFFMTSSLASASCPPLKPGLSGFLGGADELMIDAKRSGSESGYLPLMCDVRIVSVLVWSAFASSAFALFEPSASLHFAGLFPMTTPRMLNNPLIIRTNIMASSSSSAICSVFYSN